MATLNTFPLDGPGYGSALVRKMFTGTMANGYVAGYLNQLRVVASSPAAMTVEVDTGMAIVNGALLEVADGGGTQVLAVPANETGSTRLDRVVLTLDTANNTFAVNYRTGTATVYALVRTSTVYEISLAQISVANGAVSIVAANITDERHVASLCGVARGRGLSAPYDPSLRGLLAPGGTWGQRANSTGGGVDQPAPGANKWWLITEVTGLTAASSFLAWGAGAGVNVVQFEAAGTYAFPSPLVVPAGQVTRLGPNTYYNYYEITADASRTPVGFSITNIATRAVPAGTRLVITHVYDAASTTQDRIARTTGTTGAFFYQGIPMLAITSGGAVAAPEYGCGVVRLMPGVAGAGYAPNIVRLEEPFIVEPGVTISTPTGNALWCFGYEEAV
jgi:hypothetical protein